MCQPTDISKDGTSIHAWMFEKPTSNNNKNSLTDGGVEFIAAHKYKAGHNTPLDNFFNSFWNVLTNFLPMWLAPNMVTTLGALHCGLSYALLWYYAPHLDTLVPDWVVFLSGYCTLAYYTLDCMDGKQARRTGASSPLGQLFDHGFDCLCNLAHVSATGGYIMVGGTAWFLLLQTSLQFAFFMAQWEEYYTHVLPHAMGPFGVTETNYGLGLFTIMNAFVDREKVWTTILRDHLANYLSADLFKSVENFVPQTLLDMELRHAGLTGWYAAVVLLVLGSFYRVFTHENVKKNKTQLSALSKLLTPLLIAVAPFWLPEHIWQNETRYISIATGLLFSFITKKMICFSMAKMTFASIQMDAIPFWAVILWIRFDKNITELGANYLLGGLSIWYVFVLVSWSRGAIRQICERLDINCFTIKTVAKKKAE